MGDWWTTPIPKPAGAMPPLESVVRETARKHGVDEALALSVAKQESGLNPEARSPKGAIGVMQLMPGTARELGVDPADPRQNVEGGVRYLKQMMERYNGDVTKALAAYNAGAGVVDSGRPLPAETQDYVPAVMARAGTPGTAPKPQTADWWESGANKTSAQGGSGWWQSEPTETPAAPAAKESPGRSWLDRARAVFAGPGTAFHEATKGTEEYAVPTVSMFQRPGLGSPATKQNVPPAPLAPVNVANAQLEELIPEDRPGAKEVRGVVQGLENLASGVANFGLIAPLGGLPAGASRLVSAGFSADMLKNAWDRSPEFRKRLKAGDIQGAWRIGTEVLGSAAMGVTAGKHALKGKRAVTPPPEEVAVPPAVEFVPTESPLEAAKTRVRARKAKLTPAAEATPEATATPEEVAAAAIEIPPPPKFPNTLEGRAEKAKFQAKERADAIKAKAKAQADAVKAKEKAAADALKQKAADAKAQQEAQAAELKAKIQGMSPAEVEQGIAETIKALPDDQLREVAAAQELPKPPKEGEPEAPLPPLAEAVADELVKRRAGSEAPPLAEVSEVAPFRNQAGVYEPLGVEGENAHYRFTNNKGHVIESKMPRADLERLAAKGEPIEAAKPAPTEPAAIEVPPATPALGNVAEPGRVAEAVPAEGAVSKEVETGYTGAKFKKEIVPVLFKDGRKDVDASTIGGLAVHRTVDRYGNPGWGYSVTHVGSGLRILELPKLKDARIAAYRLSGLGDLSKDVANLKETGTLDLLKSAAQTMIRKGVNAEFPIPESSTPVVDRLRSLAATAAQKADAAAARRKAKLTKQPDEFSQEVGPTQEEAPQLTPEETVTDRLKELATGESGEMNLVPLVEKGKRAAEELKKQAISLGHEFQPLGSVLKREGETGKALMETISSATDRGEVKAGVRIATMREAGLDKLNREEQFNLHDVLQGRAEPMSEKVRSAVEASRSVLDEMGHEMERRGIVAKERMTFYPGDAVPPGITLDSRQRISLIAAQHRNQPVTLSVERPAKMRTDFYPQLMAHIDALKSGHVRRDIAENIKRMGLRPTTAEAEAFIDRWVKFLETGKRDDALINHLFQTGQANTKIEALSALMAMRRNVMRQKMGSMEHARQVNLPFYDPIPGRTLPNWVLKGSVFLERSSVLGQKNQIVKKAIYDIRKAGGDYEGVKSAVDRILGAVREPEGGIHSAMRGVRTFQGFKLALSAIPNATQPINILLKSDLTSFLSGIKGSMTKEGRQFGERSGAALENVIQESLKNAGAEGEILAKFLKANGFTAVEKNNRLIAANAGRAYAQRLVNRLKLDPKNEGVRYRLEELGVKPDRVLADGKLSPGNILMAAKRMSDITQFRSRAEDLPRFASTPVGKLIFQFKNFSYNQGRLVFDAVVGEMRRGQYGTAAKNLLILATVFPLTGEAISSLRNALTGKEDKKEGWDSYWGNVTQSAALGLAGDLMQSGKVGRGAAAVGGPTVSDVGDLIDLAGKKDVGREAAKFAFRRIPLVGPIFVNRWFPPKKRASAYRSILGSSAKAR